MKVRYIDEDDDTVFSPYIDNAGLLDVDEDGIEYYNAPFGQYECKFSTIKVGGNDVLHHPSQPAFYRHDGNVYFYVYGWASMIEDLPCYEETKCMLKLKYVQHSDGSYTYS